MALLVTGTILACDFPIARLLAFQSGEISQSTNLCSPRFVCVMLVNVFYVIYFSVYL